MSETTNLVVGHRYQVRWREHYNAHYRNVGVCAEFLGYQNRRCALHGDKLGREARFRRIKLNGKSAEMFDAPVSEIEVELRKEPQT